jgi:ankyrin repeat protein
MPNESRYSRLFSDDDRELRNAIYNKRSSQVEYILTNGSNNININININGIYDYIYAQTTPILYALQYGNLDIVSTLIRHGSDPNTILNGLKMTIFHFVCRYGELQNMKLLLGLKSHIINVNCRNKEGDTPLHLLMLLSSVPSTQNYVNLQSCIQLLLDHNVDVNIKNNYGVTPLFYLVKWGRIPIKRNLIQLLLNHTNTNVNMQLLQDYDTCTKGDTLLHCAVRVNNIDAVMMIYDNNSTDLLIRNSNQETAYDLAKKMHLKHIMKYMQRRTSLLQCNLFLNQIWKPFTIIPKERYLSTTTTNATISNPTTNKRIWLQMSR